MPPPKDPAARERWRDRLRESHSGLKKPALAKAMKEYWADPEWRARAIAARKGKSKQLWTEPGFRARVVAGMWKNPRPGWNRVVDGKKRCNACGRTRKVELFAANHGICIDCRRGYGDYEELLEKQGGRCAICGGGPNGRGSFFHVDHDHKAGDVRGLLCSRCNRAIGWFNDDPRLLAAAARYLRKS